MDPRTVSHYDQNAPQLADRYESADMAILQHLLLRHLEPGKVLEIGCGSGRDAAFLLAAEPGRFDVQAIDASPAMADTAVRMHPELAGRVSCAALPLPDDSPLLQSTFASVYSIAVFMHIPEEQLFDAAHQVRRLVRPGGVAIVSVSVGRAGVAEADGPRDATGRLFVERPPEALRLLFERLGFDQVASTPTTDAFSRAVAWVTLVFRLPHEPGVRSVDQIETIVRRDRKTATYKLALLRALCEIAQTHQFLARWRADGTVAVPLGLVAEKWLYYYWPLIEPDLAAKKVVFVQKRGGEAAKMLAFRPAVRALIGRFDRAGGLSAFAHAYQAGLLAGDARWATDEALNAIARTIVAGPVRFAGGALDLADPFFSFEGSRTRPGGCTSPAETESALGSIIVAGAVWREMALIGHWIGESIILRWAELTSELRARRDPAADLSADLTAEVVGRLLVRPVSERDVGQSRAIFREAADLVCVWTGDTLPRDALAVDHVIPFSLWHNNDLWNLLPTSRRLNSRKSDRLITREALLGSRDRVIHLWEVIRGAAPQRFAGEVRRSLIRGGASSEDNWQSAAFSGLVESVETVAAQRGLERWSPLEA